MHIPAFVPACLGTNCFMQFDRRFSFSLFLHWRCFLGGLRRLFWWPSISWSWILVELKYTMQLVGRYSSILKRQPIHYNHRSGRWISPRFLWLNDHETDLAWSQRPAHSDRRALSFVWNVQRQYFKRPLWPWWLIWSWKDWMYTSIIWFSGTCTSLSVWKWSDNYSNDSERQISL